MASDANEIKPDERVVRAAIDLITDSDWTIDDAAAALGRCPKWLRHQINAATLEGDRPAHAN